MKTSNARRALTLRGAGNAKWRTAPNGLPGRERTAFGGTTRATSASAPTTAPDSMSHSEPHRRRSGGLAP